MPWHLTNDKSTLVQVMTWCRQATSHYLSQCWPSSLSPYGITRLQWVNGVICHSPSCSLFSNLYLQFSWFKYWRWSFSGKNKWQMIPWSIWIIQHKFYNIYEHRSWKHALSESKSEILILPWHNAAPISEKHMITYGNETQLHRTYWQLIGNKFLRVHLFMTDGMIRFPRNYSTVRLGIW